MYSPKMHSPQCGISLKKVLLQKNLDLVHLSSGSIEARMLEDFYLTTYADVSRKAPVFASHCGLSNILCRLLRVVQVW